MQVELVYAPGERELTLAKRAIWITIGKLQRPDKTMSSSLLTKILKARHSPIRVLQFCFLIKDIPSNTSVHLCRHVHAIPFVQSLRNDRQANFDGDAAPRNTPVNMLFYCNAEELMIIANKRLCGRASKKTQEVVRMMCDEAAKAMPEIKPFLVPMCFYHGGVCHEIEPCGKNKTYQKEGE